MKAVLMKLVLSLEVFLTISICLVEVNSNPLSPLKPAEVKSSTVIPKVNSTTDNTFNTDELSILANIDNFFLVAPVVTCGEGEKLSEDNKCRKTVAVVPVNFLIAPVATPKTCGEGEKLTEDNRCRKIARFDPDM